MDPKQLGFSRLYAERKLHAIESKLEWDPELKVHYHNFMKDYEELAHMEPVNSQKGRKHVSVYHIQGNNFHHKNLD